MRVFVTGGSGYLGRSIIPALQRHGHEVKALLRSLEAAQVVTELGASAVCGSLQDFQKLREAAAEADAVIHLANDPGPQTAGLDWAAAEAMQEGIGGAPMCIRAAYGTTGTPRVSSTRMPHWPHRQWWPGGRRTKHGCSPKRPAVVVPWW